MAVYHERVIVFLVDCGDHRPAGEVHIVIRPFEA